MKKFTKVLAALGAVAMLGLGVFTSCKSDDGDDDNYVKVFYPTKATVEALNSESATASVEWKSSSINIGSAGSVSQADLTAKVNSNKGAKEVIDAIVSSYNDESVTADSLTYSYYEEKYMNDDGSDAGKTAIASDTAIAKSKTVYLLAEYKSQSGGETGTLTSVSIEGPTTAIDYNASDVTLTAKAVSTGEVTISYEWAITDENAVVTSEKTATGATYALSVNNTDADAEKKVSAVVTAKATINGEEVSVSSDPFEITVGKHGVVQPKVTSVAIGFESGKEELRTFKVGQSYKLHADVVADEGMGDVEWSAEPASAVDIVDASSDTARASETAPVTVTMKEVADSVVITLKSTKDASKFDSITLKIEAATVVDTVEEDASLDWLASDYTAEEIATEKALGVVTVLASSSKKVTVSAIAAEADYAKYGTTQTFRQYLKFGGGGSKTARALKVTTTGATTIKVYAQSGSSSEDRNLVLEDASGTKTQKTVLGSEVTLVAFEVSAAGDYWIYPEKDIRIYAISGLSKVTAVSISGGAALIAADGSLPLTAEVLKTGNPAIEYKWEITGEGATLSATDTASVTLKANNADTENRKSVSVTVTVGGVKSEALVVEIEKKGTLVEDKVTGAAITVTEPSALENGGTVEKSGTEITLAADVTATGSPTPTYAWTIDGTAAGTNSTLTFTAENDGDSEKTITVGLTVSGVTATDFTVKVPVDDSVYKLGTLTGDEAKSGKVYRFENGKTYLVNSRGSWVTKQYNNSALGDSSKVDYYTFDFKSGHNATFTAKGVYAIAVYMMAGSSETSYKITSTNSAGETVESDTITVKGTNALQLGDIFNTNAASASDKLTIKIVGVGSASMYPLAFVLYDTKQEVITITKTPSVEESLVSNATGFTFEAKSNLNASETFTWTSSDTSVATIVESTGALTNVKKGTTTITATASSGKTATYSYTVNELGITLASTAAITVGGSDKTLTATITPAGLTAEREIVFSTADGASTYLTLGETKQDTTDKLKFTTTLTAVATTKTTEGDTEMDNPVVVTATIKDTEVKAECAVTVNAEGADDNGGSVNFDVSTSESFTWSKGGNLDAGTYDDVTLAGTIKFANSNTKMIELGADGAGTATFSVTAGASVVVTVCSTGGSNESNYSLTGAGIDVTGSVTGTTLTEISGTATAAGTVTLKFTGTVRGGRFQKITVTY